MISIIGSGLVGSSIAFLCASNSLDNIVLLNRTKAKAIGESLDISNVIPKTSDIIIQGTDDYSEIKNSKIIVITASVALYSKNRNETIGAQVKMVREIAKKIKSNCNSPIVLMISNPVDVLTYYFLQETNFSRTKVIGIASSLDSSRFRFLISAKTGAKASEISDAYVLGEHGDSMVPIFSNVKINGKNILQIINSKEKDEIARKTKNYWKNLRKFKSRSYFGISKQVYDVIESIIKNKPLSIPASILLNGEYGEKDVCMGVPIIIESQGLKNIQNIKLDSSEKDLFEISANTIRNNINSV